MHELTNYTNQIAAGLATISPDDVDALRAELLRIINRGGTIFVCGNGGSAAIAEHFSCDHAKGISVDCPLTPFIVPLASNMSLITAIGNDMGYEHIFAKQIEWAGKESDGLLVISSSGNSPNILNALCVAANRRMSTMAMVGFDGGTAKTLADTSVHVHANNYGVVEDCHQIVMHALAQSIRKEFALHPDKITL